MPFFHDNSCCSKIDAKASATFAKIGHMNHIYNGFQIIDLTAKRFKARKEHPAFHRNK